jgi:hydrogenase/urease accessory protein HupE
MQHILEGVDHLMFVLALLLLIRERWMLVKTITAFTLAHSITLAAAALGWAEAPQAPVEAVVALSIVFTAAEIPRQRRRQADLASAAPWIVAFAFGLLHGFGFGGALKEIGLPQSDVPLALLTFNLGVEAGQLLFVIAVLALRASLDRLLALNLGLTREVLAYLIGSLAAAWFIQRVITMA